MLQRVAYITDDQRPCMNNRSCQLAFCVAHAKRLLLVMLLAMWMTISMGAELIRQGKRALVEATSRASLSIFQLGYRAWTHLKQPLLPRGPTIQLDPVLADQKSVR